MSIRAELDGLESENRRLVTVNRKLEFELAAAREAQGALGQRENALMKAHADESSNLRRMLSDVREQVMRQVKELSKRDAEIRELHSARDAARAKLPDNIDPHEDLKRYRGEIAAALEVIERQRQEKVLLETRATSFQGRVDSAERRVAELEKSIEARGREFAGMRTDLRRADEIIAELIGKNDGLRKTLTRVSRDRDVEVEGLKAKLEAKGVS